MYSNDIIKLKERVSNLEEAFIVTSEVNQKQAADIKELQIRVKLLEKQVRNH